MSRFVTGIFGNKPQTQAPATALRISSSVQGVPVPLLLGGESRLPCNLIDYFGFRVITSSSSAGGKGGITGGGGKGQQDTNYFASIILAVCEGPVLSIIANWVNGSGNAFAGQQDQFVGDYTQGIWGVLSALRPDHALAYRGICYVGSANYPLGNSPVLPQINFHVRSTNSFFLSSAIPDGDPSVSLISFLTDERFGVGFPSARLGKLSGTAASYQNYCKVQGLAVSPAITSQVRASAFATDILDGTNSAACWQDGLLTVVPYGDTAAHLGDVTALTQTSIVPSPNAAIAVSNIATFVADAGVSYSGGAALTLVTQFPPTVAGTYFQSNGTYYFSSADIGQKVVISYTWATGGSYVPDTVVLYDLTINDFLPNEGTIGTGSSGSSSPITIVRKPRDQMNNIVKLEYLDRNNAYNPVNIEFKDSAAIFSFRPRPTDVKQRHFFALASAAAKSAALSLVREQMGKTYQFTVGKHFILIFELMKIVTLTLPAMGLSRTPVRIIEIQENSGQTLTITAEEFPGTASAPEYGTQAAAGALLSYNQDPGLINTPLIFEPTDELGRALISTGGLMIAAAVSGQNLDLWKGCQVWASYDNQNYTQVGLIEGSARMGVLSAPLPAVTPNPTGKQTIDQANVLSVDLTESEGTLTSGTQLDATSLNTRCFVGPLIGNNGAGLGEVIAYQTAILTSTSKYALTFLVRGAYGTEDQIATWPAGTGFARLDVGIIAIPYDKTRIGSTLFLKFPSFNLWQGGQQSLSNVPAYSYVIQGSALASPLPTLQNLRTVFTSGRLYAVWDELTDFRGAIRTEIRQGDTFDGAMILGTVAHPPFALPGNGTFWFTGWCQPAADLIVRSEFAVSVAVSGATITQNVVDSFDCGANRWPGTFTGGAGVDISINAVRTGGGGNILGDTILSQLTTFGTTAIGSSVLQFSAVPPAIVEGLSVFDVTNATAIPDGAVVSAVTATTVTISIPVAAPGVGLSDLITFSIGNVLDAGGEQSGTYSPDFTVDCGRVMPAAITISMKGTGVPVGQNILGDTDILADQDILGTASAVFVDVFPLVLVSQDGVTYAAAQKYSPGDYLGRSFKFQFDLNTTDPGTIAYLLSAVISVQAPPRIDHILTNAVLPAAGIVVAFTPDGEITPAAFNNGPNGASVPQIIATWGDQQSGDVFVITGLNKSGVTIQIKNSGVGVQRNQVNVYAEGY